MSFFLKISPFFFGQSFVMATLRDDVVVVSSSPERERDMVPIALDWTEKLWQHCEASLQWQSSCQILKKRFVETFVYFCSL